MSGTWKTLRPDWDLEGDPAAFRSGRQFAAWLGLVPRHEGTGGDEGRVTGAFSGASHEGMAGVLERDDLSAGFAGRR